MKPDTTKEPKETNVTWSEKLIPIREKPPCNHYFEFVEHGECKCRSCGAGLIGVVNLVDGKPV